MLNPQITQVNNSTFQLFFSSPPTLSGVPILYYIIHIILEDIIIEIINTTSTINLLSFTNPCVKYSVVITAWNIVGMGNETNITDIVLYQSKL